MNRKITKGIVALTLIAVLITTLLPSFFVSAKNNTDIISRKDLHSYTTEIGEEYGIDAYILQAMVERESGLQIYAVNEKSGCKGLMQINEKCHWDRMENLGVTDLFDPYGNILVATDFLSDLQEINDDYKYMLMRYSMKTSTANQLYNEGKYSDYALNIIARADELRNEAKSENDTTPLYIPYEESEEKITTISVIQN